MNRKILVLLAFMAVTLFGCAKFGPPILKMTANYDPSNQTVTCKVTITDNGGCTNFSEQGGIYSLNSTPSHLDQYSVIEVVERNSTSMIYEYKTRLPQVNVTYFIRAYVKTNAGTGYSNIIAVETIE